MLGPNSQMAARLNRQHSEQVRQKIQASVIIQRLHKHFKGELELTRGQLKAAELLLDRSVPKLSQIQHSGENGGPIQYQEIVRRVVDPK